MSREATDSSERQWLPDFCTPTVALAVSIVAELALLIVLVAPDDADHVNLGQLASGTVLVQWIASICVLTLCRLRASLHRLSVPVGASAALATVTALVFASSALAHWLASSFDLGLVQARTGTLRFALSNAVVALLVAAAILRYGYVQAESQRDLRARGQAEVAALQARIRPHFLFNTLNAIATLIGSRPRVAEQAIEDLSELLRTGLAHSDALVTLGDELTLTERYLAIEALRLGPRLRTRIEVPERLRTLKLPSLTLQPLVENAIVHGIERLPEGGELSIIASDFIAGGLRLEVTNPVLPAPAGTERRGFGSAQANVRRRIQYHYGDKARLEAGSDGGYYRASLVLPDR
jgi:two-component system sensor histidine kinase AlgZ